MKKMKKMKKITLLSILCLLTLSSIAQNKFGHINAQEIVALMPETKQAEIKLQDFAKTLETQLANMQAEIQQSVQEYQANQTSYTDLVKQDKEAEITALQQRIQTFQQNAEQSYQAKEQELLVPIDKKVREAISDVANTGGFTYIFTSQILYFSTDENDISSLVKKKLGI
jgi:outer membrane protein